jgi:hypothetical protein
MAILYNGLLDGQHDYRLVFRYRAHVPALPGLHPDLRPTPREVGLSSLKQVNPRLDVFARADLADAASATEQAPEHVLRITPPGSAAGSASEPRQ